MANINLRAIVSFLFTSTGELVIPKNSFGQLDISPLCVFGSTVGVSNSYDKNLNIAVLNDDMEYKDIMAYYLAFQSSTYAASALQERFMVGNGDALFDCGELNKKVGSWQVKEMTTFDTPSFIRVGRGQYNEVDGFTDNSIVYDTQIRHVVLPKEIDLDALKNFTVMPFEMFEMALASNDNSVSDRLRCFADESQKEKMQQFTELLKEAEKISLK